MAEAPPERLDRASHQRRCCAATIVQTRSVRTIDHARLIASCTSEGPFRSEQNCFGTCTPEAVIVNALSRFPSPAASTSAQACALSSTLVSAAARAPVARGKKGYARTCGREFIGEASPRPRPIADQLMIGPGTGRGTACQAHRRWHPQSPLRACALRARSRLRPENHRTRSGWSGPRGVRHARPAGHTRPLQAGRGWLRSGTWQCRARCSSDSRRPCPDRTWTSQPSRC